MELGRKSRQKLWRHLKPEELVDADDGVNQEQDRQQDVSLASVSLNFYSPSQKAIQNKLDRFLL